MASTRLELLKNLAAQNPQDRFLGYGLAMEYRNSGDLESAMAQFRSLLAADPDYVPAYYHAAQTLERLGRLDEARQLYRQGIETTARLGDDKTRNELQAALDLLG